MWPFFFAIKGFLPAPESVVHCIWKESENPKNLNLFTNPANPMPTGIL